MYFFFLIFCVKNLLFFFEFFFLCFLKVLDDDRLWVIVDINLFDYENG